MATTSSSAQATAQLSQRKPQGHLSVTIMSVIAHPVLRLKRESRPSHAADRRSREHESTRIGDICVYVCLCVSMRLDLVFRMGPTA
jgi:hypothetical protein